MSNTIPRAAVLAAAMLLPWAAIGQGTPGNAPGEASGDAKAAMAKTSMCAGCHEIPRYKASFPSVYHVPMIAGQSARYIEVALLAYRNGDRSHPTMRAIAAGLSDKDILDLAAYYGTK